MEEKTGDPFPTWGSWSLTFVLVAWRVLTLLRAMDGAVWNRFGTDGYEHAWCHLTGTSREAELGRCESMGCPRGFCRRWSMAS